MKTPEDIGLIFLNQGGDYRHVNYINRLADCYSNKRLALGIERVSGKDDNCAQMSQAMSISLDKDSQLFHLALYTNNGAPLYRATDGFFDAFIGSNKNNACPIIFIRNQDKNNGLTRYFIWHLDYYHIDHKNKEIKAEIQNYLPQFFQKLNDAYPDLSMSHIFQDKDSDILVTNEILLSKEVFNCAATPKILPLPKDLVIISHGLDSSIRSFSIAYFPRKDFLLLSGEGEGGVNYFWAMKNPFSEDKKWVRLHDCESVINFLENNPAMTINPISDLISTFYNTQLKNQDEDSEVTHSPILYANQIDPSTEIEKTHNDDVGASVKNNKSDPSSG